MQRNQQIRPIRRLVEAKLHRWTEHLIEDKEEEIDDITSRSCTYEDVLEGRNEASFERRVNYEIKKLIMSKRLKGRRSGQGRKRVISEDAERFVAKCVEEKVTAHGRRHTSVNHRVKVRDMLSSLTSTRLKSIYIDL